MATYQEKGWSMESHDKRDTSEVTYVLDEQRRAALAEVDNAKFSYATSIYFGLPGVDFFLFFLSSWFHVKVCLVAGVGFFTDAYVSCQLLSVVWYSSNCCSYDIFAINIASVMIGNVYGKNQKLNSQQDLGIKVATPVGTLVGQVLFGWLADILGRKRMCTSCLRNLNDFIWM